MFSGYLQNTLLRPTILEGNDRSMTDLPGREERRATGQIRAETLEYGIALRIVGISSQRRRTRFAGGREFVLMLMTRSLYGTTEVCGKASGIQGPWWS